MSKAQRKGWTWRLKQYGLYQNGRTGTPAQERRLRKKRYDKDGELVL